MSRPQNALLTDLDLLLEPISEAHPCGESLRYEGTYEQVRDARREDDASLPQGVWQSELKRSEWGAVETLCAEALTRKSKDLQLAAWLLEAWIQLDGFPGAARGIQLMRRLCNTFWEQMYPLIEDDPMPRLATIQWVNDKLSRRIRMLRLTCPAMEGIPAYSLADWDVALRNPGGDTSDSVVNMAKFEQSMKLTSYSWFVELDHEVRATIQEVRSFDTLIDAKVGNLAPGLIKFRNEAIAAEQLLDTMLNATRGMASDNSPELALATNVKEDEQQVETVPLQTSVPESAPRVAPPPQTAGGRIRSRAEAYRLLAEIATFLHESDPHSPTPYLIWRAVAWGDMHFHELLPELVREHGELSDIVKLLRLDQSFNESA